MQEYFNDFKKFITRISFLLPLLIVAILCFGYSVTNSTVGIDDLERARYIGEGNVMLAAGRFGMVLWLYLTSLVDYFPYVEKVIAVGLLLVSAVNFCIVFMRATENKMNQIVYTIFSCILISYPLINEIWEYSGANLVVCGGYLLVSFLLIIMLGNLNEKKFRNVMTASVLLMIVVAGYESLVSVYIFGVFALLLLRFLYGSSRDKEMKPIWRDGLLFSVPLLVGVALRVVVHGVILAILNLSFISNGATTISYFTAGIIPSLQSLLSNITLDYILNGLWYFPITILLFCEAIAIIMMIVLTVKHRKIGILFCFSGLFFSIIILSLIQGVCSPYRACQVFAIFVAFILMLFTQVILQSNHVKLIKNGTLLVVALLCLYQSVNLNQWLALNHLRSEEEANVVRTVGYELASNYDSKKPVIFTGEYSISDGIMNYCIIPKNDWRWDFYKSVRFSTNDKVPDKMKFVQTNINSVISWSAVAFEGQTSMKKLFNYYGFDYILADFKLNEEATKYARNNMPAWPQKGYIFDNGNYIIVNFGVMAIK